MLNELTQDSLDDVRGVANVLVFPLDGLTVLNQLPDQPCKYARLANWTVLDDVARTAKPGAQAAVPNTGNAGVEMYYGFNGKLFAQLFTGNTSDLLQVNNLNQICVKGTGVVYVAWFR